MAKIKVNVGNEVAFNKLSDATWFRVESVDGFMLTVVEAGTNYAPQTIDKCAVAQVR